MGARVTKLSPEGHLSLRQIISYPTGAWVLMLMIGILHAGPFPWLPAIGYVHSLVVICAASCLQNPHPLTVRVSDK
jgi:hypothetical protein